MASINGLREQPELLALRALKLGDLLVAVPALRALRREFPEHRILYAAQEWLAPAVELVGSVDALLPLHGLDVPIDLAPGRIDVAVNLHGSGPESTGRLEALAPRRLIGHAAPGLPGPEWRHGIHERERWAGLLSWHGIAADPLDYLLLPPRAANPAPGAVVLHVGAAYGSRLWPVERFAAVAAEFSRTGRQVLLTGSASERPRALAVAGRAGLPESSVAAGELDLQAFAAVVAGAALVVSADTGAAHLASAYARPSVVIFGPAPVTEWGPPAGPHIALTDETVRVGDTFAVDPDPALLAVTVADVLAAAEKLEVL
ncbi:glycosyltransferase family 9 protein [Arthrobacter jiangjiafuii]|uniref:Glycosyltransferase family 9 protein n=1 Tax=Arthrobacter jiangjiafuii TaxID=2817475 RepID=A0A975M5X5_9MICC|nr:glycosyltransferase family 9 protein [Arthrobacter jiangjiafuii]MBP3042197.1 glycosyltransferase family 9 protein [Arthrobacter jiangjiafuii]QWC10031.1 glycosyltransferase family 9 protein [Arthrobacter jiangjiafuii]